MLVSKGFSSICVVLFFCSLAIIPIPTTAFSAEESLELTAIDKAAIAKMDAFLEKFHSQQHADFTIAAKAAWQGIPIEELSLGGLLKITERGDFIQFCTNFDALISRMQLLAQAREDVSGASAAARAVSIILSYRRPTSLMQEVQIIIEAMQHPGFQEALLVADEIYTEVLFDRLATTLTDHRLDDDLRTFVLQHLATAAKNFLNGDKPHSPASIQWIPVVIANLGFYGGSKFTEAREELRQRLAEVVKRLRAAEQFTGRQDGQILKDLTQFIDSPVARAAFLGHPAPHLDFIWYAEGAEITALVDLKGKVVVLDFWNTFCAPCINSIPDFNALASEYPDGEVVFIGVSTTYEGGTLEQPDQQQEVGRMEQMLKKGFADQAKFKIDYDIALTSLPLNETAAQFAFRGIPHTLILDAKGIIRYRGLHPSFEVVPKTVYKRRIDALLAEESTYSEK